MKSDPKCVMTIGYDYSFSGFKFYLASNAFDEPSQAHGLRLRGACARDDAIDRVAIGCGGVSMDDAALAAADDAHWDRPTANDLQVGLSHSGRLEKPLRLIRFDRAALAKAVFAKRPRAANSGSVAAN